MRLEYTITVNNVVEIIEKKSKWNSSKYTFYFCKSNIDIALTMMMQRIIQLYSMLNWCIIYVQEEEQHAGNIDVLPESELVSVPKEKRITTNYMTKWDF